MAAANDIATGKARTYLELREQLSRRDRSLRDKVVSLEEATSFVSDGDSVGIGGSTMSRTPMGMIWALIRAGRKGLTCSRSIVSSDGDLLFASGACDHIVTSWFSQGILWGVSKVMRHHVESGRARYDEWSHMAMGMRFRAGAMGVPFMPIRSMLGSDVRKQRPEAVEIDCPFSGDRILLVPALNPDVALIHVQRCDPYGNAQIDGLQFMDIDLAMAANKVILTTERIVSNDQIRRAPDRTKIPFFAVDAVVELPFGCAPHECYGVYEPMLRHMESYVALVNQDPVNGMQQYMERFVYGPKVVERVSRFDRYRRIARSGSCRGEHLRCLGSRATAPPSCSTILSARQLEDGQVVFAGVGIPLLAATLAQRLRCPGLTILFEGGVIGAFIEPGKLPPSTNDQRCTKRANMVLGSAEVLLLLQRGYVDVGFMGGAQVDQYGNLNSSFIGDPAKPKIRLPGTGGGNDIASLAQMIVAMKHERRRFVEHVDFITSPGFLRGGDTRRASGLLDRRHVPRGHRSGGVRIRRREAAHAGDFAQSRRQPRAASGQYRISACNSPPIWA